MFVGKPLGDTILFFGCRHKVEDYIYEEEIKNYHAEGTISHLYVAFSRDQVCNLDKLRKRWRDKMIYIYFLFV